MRAPIPFDTHAYVKKLIAAGVPERQAEVQAEALADIALANLATKDDLRALEERILGKLEALRSEFIGKLESLRLDFRGELSERLRQQMVWFLAVQLALFGTAIALIKLL